MKIKALIAAGMLLAAGSAIATPQEGFLCEDSPLDIPPDVFFTCEAMTNFQDGFDGQALQLFKRASLWGSKEAQYRVGLMYLGGYGTDSDLVEGAAWLLLANERNNQKVTQRLDEVLAMLDESQTETANTRAKELQEHYGDFKALERRTTWVRRMKNRTTGSRLGKPNATVRYIGANGTGGNGLTADFALSRLDLYESSLRDVLTTVEYRDFQVIEDDNESEQ